MVFSNVVRKDELRKTQLKALKEVAEALTMSFGPMGSNTLIIKDNACNRYTKDGYSILKEIKLTGAVEYSIVEDLIAITRGIVDELGDNTTSAIIMSYLLFMEMTKLEQEEKELPFVIIENFKKAVSIVADEVLKNGHACTVDDIYNIAYTSTNGNTKIANQMKSIYEEYGMDVFIDVSISNTGEDQIKEYDGLTIDTGYADTAFINNKGKGEAVIRNASIYVFDDPVDTPEMMTFFDSIIAQNVLGPWQEKRFEDVVPTVIMATMISRDLSAYMEQIIDFMYHTPEAQRPPLLIISNIHQEEQFKDIARMAGAKLIKKYINAAQQNKDIELGLAPTPLTVVEFCGHAEEVVASVSKTKFINLAGVINEDGSVNENYSSLIQFLEGEIQSAKEDGKDPGFIGGLRRRLNSLKANMVEFLVGGVSASDRDSLRDLVEDAVLNCRSAAINGVGYGANFEGLRALETLLDVSEAEEKELYGDVAPYLHALYNAYVEVTLALYGTRYVGDEEKCNAILGRSLEQKSPYNLRTESFDGLVLTSIKSDIVTLEVISKILGLMITCNQSLLQNPMMNNYYSEDRTKKALEEDANFEMATPVK